MDAEDPVIVTPSADPGLLNRQDWLNLDRRGNWLAVESQMNTTESSQDRTLQDDAENPGGKMNEYDRNDMLVGTKHAIQQFQYDAAGNLVRSDALGDMNCDGVVNFGDINVFVLAMTNWEAYAAQYPACATLGLGDINGDGVVDFADQNAFSSLVSAGLLVARLYEYDEENRLTRITEIDGDPLIVLRYDPLGRRVETWDYTTAAQPCENPVGAVQTQHVYAGLEVIEEHVLCGVLLENAEWVLAREFVWGDRFPEPLALIDHTALGDRPAGQEEVLHYHQEALGSVAVLTDAGDPDHLPEPIPPRPVERYVCDPYGRTVIERWDAGTQAWVRVDESVYGNPFIWTAQRYDAGVKLYSLHARTYSPELGRWLQRDPLGYVDGVNLYEYVRSRPTAFVDPLGLMSIIEIPEEFGGGGGGGGAESGIPMPDPQPEPCGGGGADGRGDQGWVNDGFIVPWPPFGPLPPPPPPPTFTDPPEGTEPDYTVIYSVGGWLDRNVLRPGLEWLGGGHLDDQGYADALRGINQETRGARQTALWVGVGLAALTVCFTEDTLVLTDAGFVPIQDLCVGDRVLTTNDLEAASPSDDGGAAAGQPDADELWVVTLGMPNPQCSSDVIELQCLRSRDWVIAHDIEPGRWIPFELSELDLRGPAFVVSVDPCPALDSGPGHLVITTMTHLNSVVLKVWLAEQDEPIEPTAVHRFYSEDRGDWVAAGDLAMGERLRTLDGPLAVTRIERKPGTHRVYNIQVEGEEHCYFVSSSGVLSHNFAGCVAVAAIGFAVGTAASVAATDALLDAGNNPDGVELTVDFTGIGLAWGGMIGGSLRGGGAGSPKGALTTPRSYFGGETGQQAIDALTAKKGPPTYTPPGKSVWYDPRTGRSIVIHDEPGHGGPHVDITRRGGYPPRKIHLK